MYRFISLAMVAGSLATVAAAQPQQEAPKPISKADFNKTVAARFAAIDTDKDGSLSVAEIAAVQTRAMQQAAANQQQQIEAEFKKLDTNKDNQLSMAEFKAAAPPVKAAATPAQLVAELDANKDGKISPTEYGGPPMASFDRMDANKDGTLTPQEAQAARRR